MMAFAMISTNAERNVRTHDRRKPQAMITAAAQSGQYRRWTRPEVERLFDLRRQRLTRVEIARRLGRSFKAVKWALYVRSEAP